MRQYQDMVFTTAFRLLANQADAEDVAQTTFLKAYEHFDDLAESSTAGGWLKKVATNQCLNHLSRYQSRWRFFSDLEHDSSGEESGWEPAGPDGATDGMEARDRKRLLEEALQKLPAQQRISLVLYHFEEMSCEDIAARLQISLSKVKMDMHRGRERLRRKLKL